MPKKKKEVIEEVEVVEVKADVMPVCPVCGSESVIVERQPIFKCLSCINRFQ